MLTFAIMTMIARISDRPRPKTNRPAKLVDLGHFKVSVSPNKQNGCSVAPEQNAAEPGAGANHHAAGSTARGCHRRPSRRSHTQTHATIIIDAACRECWRRTAATARRMQFGIKGQCTVAVSAAAGARAARRERDIGRGAGAAQRCRRGR